MPSLIQLVQGTEQVLPTAMTPIHGSGQNKDFLYRQLSWPCRDRPDCLTTFGTVRCGTTENN